MRPCVGIPGTMPPMAYWREMIDGTYTLYDVLLMHETLDEIEQAMKRTDR